MFCYKFPQNAPSDVIQKYLFTLCSGKFKQFDFDLKDLVLVDTVVPKLTFVKICMQPL